MVIEMTGTPRIELTVTKTVREITYTVTLRSRDSVPPPPPPMRKALPFEDFAEVIDLESRRDVA
jgi:hypothetical protein